MLTPYSRSNFVEKVLTDQSGRQFRALFLVTLSDNGEVKGHLLSLKPLPIKTLAIEGAVSDGTICLPCWTADCEIETPYIDSYAPAVSPYFSELDIFLSTQPTRAPSHI